MDILPDRISVTVFCPCGNRIHGNSTHRKCLKCFRKFDIQLTITPSTKLVFTGQALEEHLIQTKLRKLMSENPESIEEL